MIFILIAFFLSTEVKAQPALSVPIYIFELKPLIYQDEKKQIHGAWYESFEKLARIANLNFDYQFVSIPRMELLLSGPKPGCNLTMFKTKKREETINFIFDHKELSVLKVYQRTEDSRVWDFKKMQEDKKLKIVSNSSVAVDMLAEKNIKAELLFNVNSIVHMLMMKRIDIYVGSNLAVETMDEFKKKKIKHGITVKTIIHGIGCSRGTPDVITSKLKKAARSWTLEDKARQ